MEWFENPTIAGVLGGIAGAIVAGLISVFMDLSQFNSASSSHLGHFSFEVCG